MDLRKRFGIQSDSIIQLLPFLNVVDSIVQTKLEFTVPISFCVILKCF